MPWVVVVEELAKSFCKYIFPTGISEARHTDNHSGLSSCNKVCETCLSLKTGPSVTAFDSCQSQQLGGAPGSVILLIFTKYSSTT